MKIKSNWLRVILRVIEAVVLNVISFSAFGCILIGAIGAISLYFPATSAWAWTESEWGQLGSLLPAACGAVVGAFVGLSIACLRLLRDNKK